MFYMGTVVRALGCRFQINSDDHGEPHCRIAGHGKKMKVSLKSLEMLGDTEFSEFAAKWEEYHGKEES